MRRCIPLWFYPVALAAAVGAYALGAALKPEPEVSLIFETYYRDGRRVVQPPVYSLNTDPRGPVDITKRAPMTRRVGYEQDILLSSSRQRSSNNIRVRVRWQTLREYLQWLENDFIEENNLNPKQWRPIIQQLKEYAQKGKQHYPIIVPDTSSDFWKN